MDFGGPRATGGGHDPVVRGAGPARPAHATRRLQHPAVLRRPPIHARVRWQRLHRHVESPGKKGPLVEGAWGAS